MNHHLAVWDIKAKDFPSSKSSKDKILFLLGYGILAPSAHNTQPWKCKIEDATVSVFFDDSHELPVSDPTRRQGYLSLGAFVTNIVEAAKAFGCTPEVKWLPDGETKNAPVAKISFKNLEKATAPSDTLVLDTIVNRRVNRSLYQDKKIPEEVSKELPILASDPDLAIHIVEEQPHRQLIAQSVADGLGFAFANPTFREELSHFVVPNTSNRPDGIPGYTSELNTMHSLLMPHMIKNYNLGESQGALEKKRFMSAPAIAVISATTDDLQAWLKAGALYEEVVLYLTRHNIAHAVSGAPVEAPLLPMKVQKATASDFRPMMVFRIGYPTKPSGHSPRRPVSDIVEK